MKSDIRCVTFDLDDTLWAIHPVILSAEKKFYEWMTNTMPEVTEKYSLEDLTRFRQLYFKDNPELHHDLTQMRKNWMAGLAEEFNYPGKLLNEGFQVFWNERNNVTLFDRVEDALSHTRERYITGAITNGNADLNTIGINHYFDFFLTSAEVGYAKPHPAIFEAASKHSKLSPENIVHVGDDPKTDVEGAARVGMKTIWVNPAGHIWEGSVLPDAEIQSIAELPTLLDRF